MTSYKIKYKPEFKERLEELEEEAAERIKDKIREFRKQINEYNMDPRHLNNTKFIPDKRSWRLRIGDFRAFFDIAENLIEFTTVLRRNVAYR